MTSLRDETRGTYVPNKLYQGVIQTGAVHMGDLISVVIPGLSADAVWGDCRWQSKDNITLPQKGNECLVSFDDTGQLWVSSWWAMPYVVDTKWIKGVNGEAVWNDIVVNDIKNPVEGQWIKGVGGASVWAPITTPDLPPQWRAAAWNISNTGNWNTITETGFYMGSNVANAPDGNWYIGYVQIHIANLWVVQRLWQFAAINPAQPYQRQCFNGTWTPWVKLGDWQPYQPWFNGSPYGPYGISGRFSQIGKTVNWYTELDVVNGTNTGPGDQAYLVGLPSYVQLPGGYGIVGQGYMYNSNGGYFSDVLCQVSPGTNYFQMIVRNVGTWGVAAVTPVGPPIAFSPGSQFICSGTYESTTYTY